MARGITQNMVDSAADALVVAGERPTLERIRLKLGTGAPNTIARMLDHWWKALGQRLTAAAAVDIPNAPESVQRTMGDAWLQAWSAAKELSDARVAEREASLAAREAALSTKALSDQERDRAQTEQVSALEAERTSLRQELVQERARVAESARALSDTLSAHREIQAQLKVLIEENQARDRRYQMELERAAAQETRWLREVDRERELRKKLEGDQHKLAMQLGQEAARRQSLSQKIQDLEAQLTKARGLLSQRAGRSDAADSGAVGIAVAQRKAKNDRKPALGRRRKAIAKTETSRSTKKPGPARASGRGGSKHRKAAPGSR